MYKAKLENIAKHQISLSVRKSMTRERQIVHFFGNLRQAIEYLRLIKVANKTARNNVSSNAKNVFAIVSLFFYKNFYFIWAIKIIDNFNLKEISLVNTQTEGPIIKFYSFQCFKCNEVFLLSYRIQSDRQLYNKKNYYKQQALKQKPKQMFDNGRFIAINLIFNADSKTDSCIDEHVVLARKNFLFNV